jgi:hypothetical protein
MRYFQRQTIGVRPNAIRRRHVVDQQIPIRHLLDRECWTLGRRQAKLGEVYAANAAPAPIFRLSVGDPLALGVDLPG